MSLKDGFYFPDSVDYTAAAANLLVKGEFADAFNRAPGYPIFLAGIFAMLSEQIAAIRLVEAVVGACLAVVISIIAKRTGGALTGVLAGFIWGLYPLGIFIVGLVYPTNLAAMLLACSIVCMLTPPGDSVTQKRALVGGLFLGLTALTIPVALLTVIAVIAWLVYWEPKRRIVLVTVFLTGVILPLAPWTARNFYVHHRFVPVEPRLVQHLPPFREVQPSQMDENVHKITAIGRNPDWYARHVVKQFWRFWELAPNRLKMNRPGVREQMHAAESRIVRETAFGNSWTVLASILTVGPMFVFASLGMAVMIFEKERRRSLTLICGTIFSFAIGYSLLVGRMRYRIPVEPYIVTLSAYGMCQTLRLVGKKSRATAETFTG